MKYIYRNWVDSGDTPEFEALSVVAIVRTLHHAPAYKASCGVRVLLYLAFFQRCRSQSQQETEDDARQVEWDSKLGGWSSIAQEEEESNSMFY